MLMASEFVRVVGTRGARTTGHVSRSLRGVLRPSRTTRWRQPVHPRPPERQLPQIDAADGGPAALERCGVLSAPAAFHLAFALVGDTRLDALAGGAAGSSRLLLVDETAFPKHGDQSVAVGRQYCGALGKIANCQVAVSTALLADRLPGPPPEGR